MAELVLDHIEKRFAGGVTAIHELDLTARSGEFVSLLGPSGCGKTTALRIVAGFEQPSAGRVLIDGQEVTHVPAAKRDMGMVFQAYSLFPNMTAQANVEFGLRIRGNDRAQRAAKAVELLELVGLGQAATRYPHQLSGGMQQRVALARALAIEPRVLLLDEPLSALDAKVRVQLREEIRRIQQRLGITTLYVTHDQEEALAISDRIAVLSQGRIEQLGTPAAIYAAPETPFVAEFVGTMNRVEATVSSTPGVVELPGASVRVTAATGYHTGDRVLLLVRPEQVELELVTGDDAAQTATGPVVSQTFLGSVTRVKVALGAAEVAADVSTARAARMPIDTHVAVIVDPDGARLLTLAPSEQVASAPAALTGP